MVWIKTLATDKNYQYKLDFSLFIYSNSKKNLVYHNTPFDVDYSKLNQKELLDVNLSEPTLLDEYFFKGYDKLFSTNLDNNPAFNHQMATIKVAKNSLNEIILKTNKNLEINEFIDNKRFIMLEITRIPIICI